MDFTGIADLNGIIIDYVSQLKHFEKMRKLNKEFKHTYPKPIAVGWMGWDYIESYKELGNTYVMCFFDTDANETIISSWLMDNEPLETIRLP